MNNRFKILFCCGLIFACVDSSCAGNASKNEIVSSDITISSDSIVNDAEISCESIKDTIPIGAKVLLEVYSDWIKDYKDGMLIFADGSNIVYDDGVEKDFETMLDNSSPKDMFYVAYDDSVTPPLYLNDAGRSRCEALFKKMYGASSSAVQRNLVSVPWLGGNVKFTRINGAADQLKKVYEELSNYPELRKYLKGSGTFYWRNVRGAKRLSAHSYGIAFDIGVEYSDYWLWKNPGKKETDTIKYNNRIPKQIVEIFRKHGFIWGGAWYHFDTMHFEYRPEILKFAQQNASPK